MTTSDLPKGLAKARGGAFYLHGDDLFRKDLAAKALIAAHLDPATADFNLDRLNGPDVDAETLASILATPPMMAEWRVVLVRDVQGVAGSKKAREELLAVVKKPPPGLALIMTCTVPQGSRAKLYRELARLAQAVEFKPFTEADVPGWLMERARKEHSMTIAPEAAQALAAAIGTNLGVLAREMDKLAEFVGDRDEVTVADVEAAGTKLPKQDRWRWFDLVGDRRFEEARATLDILLDHGETGVGLVIGLSSQLLRLGVAATEGPSGLESVLPPHQKWLAKKIGSQARQWPADELDQALDGLLRVDRFLKASAHRDKDIHFLEEWLLGMMVRSRAA